MRRWDRLLDSYIEEYAARGVSKESVAMNRARIERWGRWLKARRPRVGIELNAIRPDAEDTLARLKNAGANEVVIMRVVRTDKQPAYKLNPGSSSNGSDTLGTGNLPATAEQQQFDTLVSVETLVYSLDRNEPLWSSTSRPTNPQDIAHLVNEVANATAKEMHKQGLLASR